VDALEQERAGPGLSAKPADAQLPTASTSHVRPALSYIAKELPKLILFAIGYAVACRYAYFFLETSPAPLWFPDSVLLCVLLLARKRDWILYLLIGLPIRLVHSGVPSWFVLATYSNDCLKAIFSAYLLQRLLSRPIRLNTLRQFGIYLGVAALAAPALSGLAGGLTRAGIDRAFWTSWYEWSLGNAIAAIVLTPTLLYWCLGEWRELKARALEFFLLVLTLCAVLYAIFAVPHASYSPVVLYAPMPFLIWAAIRCSPVGVSTTISLVALVSILGTFEGRGPFLAGYAHHSLISMQLFLAVISVPMLFVAILLAERRAVEKDLENNRAILRENYRRAQDLARKLLTAQEHERQRIARELHDDIGQRLALLSVKLDGLAQGMPTTLEKERSSAGKLFGEVQELSGAIHDLSHQLHSTTLQHMGLEKALRNLCRVTASQYQIELHVEFDEFAPLSDEANLCLFRVAQEALKNAVSHGHAKQIHISLRKRETSLRMTVKDSGDGFDPSVVGDGLGLVSMQERLRMLGGTVAVKSHPGVGTEVTAELPIVAS
jgi:two-component system sensor histidine kinase UhpB